MMCSTSTRWLARKRAAGRHQVDDRIGQAGQRRQLHAAVQLDQIGVNPLGGEELARDRHVLGRHRQPRALAHTRGIVETFAHRHADAALGDLQVERLVQAVTAMFEQGVAAGDADVGATVLHVGRHVGGAHHQHPHIGAVGIEYQLARLLGIVEHLDIGGAQQRQRLLEDAALGQRQRDHAALVTRNPFDVGAEGAQLRLHPVVTAVQMVDAVDHGLSVGDQAGDHQAGRCAQIGRHDAGAGELLDTLHHRSASVDLDLRAQAHQFVDVHEAVLEDGLGHGGRAMRNAVERHELGLHVGRETRVLGGTETLRLQPPDATAHGCRRRPASTCAPAASSFSITASR